MIFLCGSHQKVRIARMVCQKGQTLISLAKTILSRLSEEEILNDFVNWVKMGQLYHLVGTILGEGSCIFSIAYWIPQFIHMGAINLA